MNLDSDKRKSMADSQRFKLISAELSPGWGSLGYLDAGRALVAVYETLGPLFQALIPKGDVPFEPALIPMPQTIAKHLYGIGWATYKTRDGVRIELASPIGAVPLVLAAGIGNTLSQLVRKQRQAYARKTQATPQISFNFKNMPLTQALDQIARTSGVTIMYTRNAVKGVAVSGQVKQVALGQAIARLLPPQLAYRIRETPSGKTQVVVYKAAISGDQKKTQERSR